jgi:nicotinamidase-related amidase
VPTHFALKGEHPLTENYSVLSPEVRTLEGTPVGHFNTALAERLLSYDRVYVFGQAKSHCVLATLADLRDFALERDPKRLGRIHILEDAMSPVPPPPLHPLPPALDFPRVAEEAFARFAEAGMKLVRTSEVL